MLCKKIMHKEIYITDFLSVAQKINKYSARLMSDRNVIGKLRDSFNNKKRDYQLLSNN